jgi:glycosyltransferase involved in cell wall biosynthesis
MNRQTLLVHEWIEKRGGAERVLDALGSTFPQADVACLWNDAPDRFDGREVRETLLARTPLRRRKALALPLMPVLWRTRLVRRRYERAVVSTHLFAHHAKVRGVSPRDQFTYVHTPARYLWNPELDERGQSPAVRLVAPLFRWVDRRRGSRLRHVAANSSFVAERIRRAWHVDARVIHPPVEVERLQSVPDWADEVRQDERRIVDGLPDGFVLGASRFVPYKRLELVIRAGAAAGRPVVIAGDGPERSALERAADRSGADVRFVIDPSDALMSALMQRAAVYVFPPVEDFGIMPVEALALGTPVVVNRAGGARDSVVDGVSGCVVADVDDDAALAAAVERAVALDPAACRARAARFSSDRFRREIEEWVGISRR